MREMSEEAMLVGVEFEQFLVVASEIQCAGLIHKLIINRFNEIAA